MERIRHTIQLFLSALLGVLIAATLFSFSTTVKTVAQSFEDPEACRLETNITMADILAPTRFIPVLPEDCTTDGEGRAVPLSFAVLPDIALRFFGALASLVFYLFFFIAVFSGIQWIYGGIENKQALNAKRNFQDSFLGLVLVLSVYVIINTILVFLEVNFQYTSIDQFFTFG